MPSPYSYVMHRSSWPRFGPSMRALLGLVGLGMLAGCVDDGWETRRETQRGDVCFQANRDLSNDAGAAALEADAPLHVAVIHSDCLPRRCTRRAKAHCKLTVSGEQVTLSSSFEWEEPMDEVECSLLCDRPFATCDSEPLPEGHYTLRHGSRTIPLEVPGPAKADCAFYGPYPVSDP